MSVTSTRLILQRDCTFLIRMPKGKLEGEESHYVSGMIWTSLKQVEALGNACFALSSAIGRRIVLNTTKEPVLRTNEGELFLHAVKATEEDEGVHNVASTRFLVITCNRSEERRVGKECRL